MRAETRWLWKSTRPAPGEVQVVVIGNNTFIGSKGWKKETGKRMQKCAQGERSEKVKKKSQVKGVKGEEGEKKVRAEAGWLWKCTHEAHYPYWKG